jgi:hypothetical protein
VTPAYTSSTLSLSGRFECLQPLNPIQEPTPSKSLPQKADTASPPSGCTNGSTNEANPVQPGSLAALAAALLGLSLTDRARLAAMLLGQQPEGKVGENAL